MPTHRKSYIPLESNPLLFTQLIHHLGVSPDLSFVDVYSIEDASLLSLVPRPVLALILVFPTSPEYEQHKTSEEGTLTAYKGSGEGEDVVWYKQTIHNACGLYAILHAVSNGDARGYINPDSTFSHLLAQCYPLAPHERALALEASDDLEIAHAAAAVQGDSAVPQNPEDEVNFHYLCFTKSHKTGHVFEMDGNRKGPIDRGALLKEHEDLLSPGVLKLVEEFVEREKGENLNFSLMALVVSPPE